VRCGDPGGVASLLDRLREPGAAEQAAALTSRLQGVGLFRLFLDQQETRTGSGLAGRLTTAPPVMGWDDLE
jgi:hypothetical protein